MFTLFLCIIFAIAAAIVWFQKLLTGRESTIKSKLLGIILTGLSTIFFFAGSISYNDSGKCTHVQTIFGTESGKCSVGWYFSGWGTTTEYPYQIEVTNNKENPYSVKMADNWTGDVYQTTRFIIPQNEQDFIKLHQDFRSLDRLVNTVLRPAVTLH